MNLLTSIQDLLYDHECVVLPNFGGFVTNYKAAYIHPKKEEIYPPSKQVSFNINLTNNDGLLSNYISQKEQVSYSVAKNFVESTIAEFNSSLKNNGRLSLEGLGVLSINNDGQIEFAPDESINFLKQSFGLGPTFLPKLSVLKGENNEEEEAVEIPLNQESSAPVKISRKWAAAAILLPLVLVGGFAAHQNKGNLSSIFSGVFPERATHHISYVPRIEEEALRFEYDTPTSDLQTISDQNPELQSVYYSFSSQEISPKGIEVILNDEQPALDLKSKSKLGLYFIVGGAFAEKANAQKLVGRLQNKGYDATIFGKKGKLHMVSFGSYATKSAARKELKKIKKQYPGAWLKKH